MKHRSKHIQACNLYFETDLTQAQIADLVGISHKTMSMWVNQNGWRRLLEATEQMPSAISESMLTEIVELNKTIRSREPGNRIATPHEAEVRRKTLASLNYVQRRASIGMHYEVMMNFMKYIEANCGDEDVLIDIISYGDDYLKKEQPLKNRNALKPHYSFHTMPHAPEPDTAASENTEEYQQRWNTVVKKFRQQNDRHSKDAKIERETQNPQ